MQTFIENAYLEVLHHRASKNSSIRKEFAKLTLEKNVETVVLHKPPCRRNTLVVPIYLLHESAEVLP